MENRTFKSLDMILLMRILLVSSVITALMTSISLYSDYSSEMTELERVISQIEKTSVPSISKELWDLDLETMNSQLSKIVDLPQITSIRVFDERQKLVSHFDDKDAPTESLFSLRFSMDDPYQGSAGIGVVEITVTKMIIYQRLMKRTGVFFATQGVKTFFVSFCILFLVRYYVTNHLKQISRFFEGKAYKKAPLSLKHRSETSFSELDVMVQNINEMTSYVNESEDGLREDLGKQKAVAINSARLASLGEMAGGIAHEINNPLAIVVGNIHIVEKLLRQENIEKDKILGAIAKIVHTTDRIAGIVSALKTYSRNGNHDPLRPRGLKQIVEEALSLCTQKYAVSGISLTCDNIPQEVQLNCRPSEISQVLLSLLNNAFDAVEHLKEKWVRLSCHLGGKHILIKIEDSGAGVPPDDVERIFEPFFSTKEVGEGTGLGLPIARNIIEAHGGVFFLDHKVDHTSFVISLPLPASSTVEKKSA